ncbi:VMAP-C domain-containing protein [Yinghuangia aomiensis]
MLLDGLDKSSVPRLEAIHRHAAGDAFAVLPGVVGTAAEAYEHLARINLPADGIARSLRFLTDLAAVVPSDRGDALRTWISRQVRASAPEPQAAQAVLDDLLRGVSGWRQDAKSPAYLLIRLAPSSSGNRIDVTYWTNYGTGWEPRRRDDRSLDADQVRAYVATVLDREEAHLHAHRGNLVVEFILPLSMIHEPVQLWSRHGVLAGRKIMDTEFGGPPLHYDYTVYVRSLERIDTLHWHRAWRMRWEAPETQGGARMHRCRRGEGARHDGLYARLAGDPAIAVLGLSAPPDDPHGAQGAERRAGGRRTPGGLALPFRRDHSDTSMIPRTILMSSATISATLLPDGRLRSASRTGTIRAGAVPRPAPPCWWDGRPGCPRFRNGPLDHGQACGKARGHLAERPRSSIGRTADRHDASGVAVGRGVPNGRAVPPNACTSADDTGGAWWDSTGGTANSPTAEALSDRLPPPPPWRDFDRPRRGGAPLPTTTRRCAAACGNPAVTGGGFPARPTRSTPRCSRRPLIVTRTSRHLTGQPGPPGEPGTRPGQGPALDHAPAAPPSAKASTSTTPCRIQETPPGTRRPRPPRRAESTAEKTRSVSATSPARPVTGLVPADPARPPHRRAPDKADTDLANDLLGAFEEGEFSIPEAVPRALPDAGGRRARTDDPDGAYTVRNGRIRCRAFPFVVITSNGERTMPPAFLRRCLTLTMEPPAEEELAAILAAQFAAAGDDDERTRMIRDFVVRAQSSGPLPTDQLHERRIPAPLHLGPRHRFLEPITACAVAEAGRSWFCMTLPPSHRGRASDGTDPGIASRGDTRAVLHVHEAGEVLWLAAQRELCIRALREARESGGDPPADEPPHAPTAGSDGTRRPPPRSRPPGSGGRAVRSARPRPRRRPARAREPSARATRLPRTRDRGRLRVGSREGPPGHCRARRRPDAAAASALRPLPPDRTGLPSVAPQARLPGRRRPGRGRHRRGPAPSRACGCPGSGPRGNGG